MTVFAEAMLQGLAENAVDFRPNYDGRLEEPSVLPAQFPKPAGQWLIGDRGGHGDQHSAA